MLACVWWLSPKLPRQQRNVSNWCLEPLQNTPAQMWLSNCFIYGTVIKKYYCNTRELPSVWESLCFSSPLHGVVCDGFRMLAATDCFFALCARLTKVNLVQHLFSVFRAALLRLLYVITSCAAGFHVESACCSPDVEPDACLSCNLDRWIRSSAVPA